MATAEPDYIRIGRNLTTKRVVVKEAKTHPDAEVIHIITSEGYCISVDKASLGRALQQESKTWAKLKR